MRIINWKLLPDLFVWCGLQHCPGVRQLVGPHAGDTFLRIMSRAHSAGCTLRTLQLLAGNHGDNHSGAERASFNLIGNGSVDALFTGRCELPASTTMISSFRALAPWFAATILAGSGLATPAQAADAAVDSINATGLALHRLTPANGGNALLSPWSIQNVMAMVFAGANGVTKEEMDSALHLGGDDIHAALKTLSTDLAQPLPKGAELRTAYRLFPANSCKLLPGFMETITQNYAAAVEPLDFSDPGKATTHINSWVAEQTGQKIKNPIPPGALNMQTRLVLTNAVYFKVPWQVRFTKELTKDQPFLMSAGMQKTAPLMSRRTAMRYAKKSGFQMVALPYIGGQFQFTVIVPDKVDGLAAVEKALTPALLAECATMPKSEVRLTLPRFRVEPPVMELQPSLAALGMPSAFSQTANFSRMTSDSLYISKVFHKTFIDVNEDGTEAAAVTAAAMAADGHPHEIPHMVVRADHPFFFAIQHIASGTCLFLGRLTDPDSAKPAAKAATPKPSPAKN